MRYITRYVKEHYVNKKIRRDLYERCAEAGYPILDAYSGFFSIANLWFIIQNV